MTAPTGSIAYQRGLELAEGGQYAAALGHIEEHLRANPNDAQALNDAGAILHCLGRSNDAITYLIKARELQPDSGEIVWNLVETYLAAGKAADGTLLVETMEGMGILNIDVMNRLATQLLNQGKKGQAVEILLKSNRLWPNQEVLDPILHVIRSKRPKVAFFGCHSGDTDGLGQICSYVAQRFVTEFCASGLDEAKSDLLDWCDIAWFHGGDRKVVEMSQKPHDAKVVVSLRHSDINETWVKDVRWENIDIVVQIGGCDVEERLRQWIPNIRNRTRLVTIPIGVDTSRYPFRQRSRGKNLACMGGLSEEANPAFLVQCMQKLHYIDREFKLFFAGRFQNPALEQYLRHMVETLDLADVVHFEPVPSDWNAWLSDKHFVVSGSTNESLVERLLMGMASGIKPIIHNFPGAEKIFPSEYLFNIAEDFCHRILVDAYEPTQYHCLVEEKYSIREQFQSVNDILAQLESEIDWKTSNAPDAGMRGGAGTPVVAVGKARTSKAMAANV